MKGRVYASEDSPDEVTDLLDEANKPIVGGILSDSRGMIPQFQGPDGAEQLWLDFNDGRVMLLANDVGPRFANHLKPNLDPHGDRSYAHDLFSQAVSKTASNDMHTVPTDALLNVESPSGTNDVIRLNRSSAVGSSLKSNGALYLDPFTNSTPLVVYGTNLADDKPVLTVDPSSADASNPALRIYKNGDINTSGKATIKGDLNVQGQVIAGNIGTNRVFSGTADPTTTGITPNVGDVWVSYGA
ncbi:hypothetical protein ACN20G_23415 [Streptomyces sp. BI20]|uniref:hypothetical protein n=1 Tax=Streptomyces sp. BI20 TaxID=3403460 RepID=UPI003C73001E